MADYALPVIKAVIAKLKADSDIAGIVGDEVYTDVPQKAEFPYIRVSITGDVFEADDISGQEHRVRVQAFSRKAGTEECLTIRAAAFAALDRKESELSISPGTLVVFAHSGVNDAFIEDDGKTWQSVLEFKAITY